MCNCCCIEFWNKSMAKQIKKGQMFLLKQKKENNGKRVKFVKQIKNFFWPIFYFKIRFLGPK